MRLFLLLLSLGYISTGVAQINLDEDVEINCPFWNEDYDILSFSDLDELDFLVLRDLDNQLMGENLFISDCFIFRETPVDRDMITLRFTNSEERVYIVRRQLPLQVDKIFNYEINSSLPRTQSIKPIKN